MGCYLDIRPGEPERGVLVRSAEEASPDHLTTRGACRADAIRVTFCAINLSSF